MKLDLLPRPDLAAALDARRLDRLAAAWSARRLAVQSTAGRWVDDRSPRERWLLAGLAGLLLVAALNQFVWQPLSRTLTAARADIARYDRLAAQLRAAGPDVARVAAARRGTLPTVVTERAAKAGLTIARIEPQGSTVAVTLDGVGFDALIDWIAMLDRDAGIIVVDLTVDRRPDPGVVSAQVTLRER